LAFFGTGSALLAVLLVAGISSMSTRVEVSKLIAEGEDRNSRLTIDKILRWHQEHNSWEGADQLFAETGKANAQQLMLLDGSNHCVLSFPAALCSMRIMVGPHSELKIVSGDPLRQEIRELIGIPSAEIFDGPRRERTWKIFVLPSEAALPGAPRRFFESLTRSLWMSAGVAVFVAVSLSILFARTLLKPVRELAMAVRSMQSGDFSHRVSVHGDDELSMLGRAFNSMVDEVQRQERLRKDLFHNVAHELRTPLTNLRCQLESFQDGLAVPTFETLASSHEEVMLLSRMVDDLRDIALAEAGQLSLEIQDCDASAELRSIVRTASPLASGRSIHLRLEVPDSLRISADPGRLRQILNNLIMNAVRHTPSGSVVTIRAREEHLEALIEVLDDGPGIEPDHLPFVFDRFYRADPARSRGTGGAGLGLAIVKQLVTLQGGSIRVTSDPGLGCCFIVSLPLLTAGHAAN
jgi:signal transduction histidine kinase